MLNKRLYSAARNLGLKNKDVDDIISSNKYKARAHYGTVSSDDLYKAGTRYGAVSPKDIYKAGTWYGTLSIRDF